MILRATILHTPRNPFHEANALEEYPDGGLCFERGVIQACGDYGAVRARFPEAAVRELRGIVLPGLIDTHVHYPQVRILGAPRGTLLEWLEKTTLPEEAKFQDTAYASEVADEFLRGLASTGTTTALVFGAHFAPATAILLEKARRAGLRIISGLVLADRALRSELHTTPEQAYRESSELIRSFGPQQYAVTPRFALSTSEAMLEVCGALMREYPDVRFQTHVNENIDEVAAVARAFPNDRDYLAVYERFGLVGPRSVFAHSVHSTDDELQRLALHHSGVAYCPSSNAALGSGTFPIQRHLQAGVKFALGSDIGAGTGFGILKEGLQAYLTQRLAVSGMRLNAAQLLFLATRAGAEVLGLESLTGDFTAGKAADFLCLSEEGTLETWVEGKRVFPISDESVLH